MTLSNGLVEKDRQAASSRFSRAAEFSALLGRPCRCLREQSPFARLAALTAVLSGIAFIFPDDFLVRDFPSADIFSILYFLQEILAETQEFINDEYVLAYHMFIDDE